MTDAVADETEAEIADLAAEPDDAPGATTGDTMPDDTGDDSDDQGGDLFTGLCHGGPWNGRTASSRYPAGFLLIDTARDLLWIYDYTAATRTYVARTDAGAAVHDDGPDNRWRAADESAYDVRVIDPDGDPNPEQVTP